MTETINPPAQASTPAQKKRRPFVIKNGEQSHYIYCSGDPAAVATFYCVKCHKPFGEGFVGEEIGEQSVCSLCVESRDQDEVASVENRQRNRRIRNMLVGGITAIIVSANIFYLVQFGPASERAAKPELSPQLSALVECRHHLETLAEQARFFQQAMERAPESIEELYTMLEDSAALVEPLTQQPYLIGSDSDGTPKILCPHPEAHGLAELFAVPGKPAKMVYQGRTAGGV